MSKIIAIHLLNDHSGSPLVFRQALEALRQRGHTVVLYTATPSGTGFLSNIKGITYKTLPYRWHTNKWLTLLFFMWSQLYLLVKLSLSLRRGDKVYINTLLPFGAAMIAYWRGCKVIYHIHEVSIKPVLLKKFLTRIAALSARQLIFVSEYVRGQYAFAENKTIVIHNALSESFGRKAAENSLAPKGPFTVLMLCSLKTYKGIEVFIECACQLPHLQFELVLNAEQPAVNQWAQNRQIPGNCTLYPTQTNTHPFYQRAHLVVNLSLPDQWIETFGMTVLEGMAYGLPVIVPPVGGVRELITDGVEGFCVDARNTAQVIRAIDTLAGNPVLYQQMSQKSKTGAKLFSIEAFNERVGGL